MSDVDKNQPTAQAAPADQDEGISREQWIEAATRVYLVAGDTEDEARECAKALCREQNWDPLQDDLADPYDAAMSDIEGRGPAPAAGAVAGPTREQMDAAYAVLWPDSMCNPTLEERRRITIRKALTAAFAAAPTPAAQAADSVLEDAAQLDFIEQHPEMSLRHRKGKWAFVGFTNYEYEMLPSLRDAIRAARKQGGKHDNH